MLRPGFFRLVLLLLSITFVSLLYLYVTHQYEDWWDEMRALGIDVMPADLVGVLLMALLVLLPIAVGLAAPTRILGKLGAAILTFGGACLTFYGIGYLSDTYSHPEAQSVLILGLVIMGLPILIVLGHDIVPAVETQMRTASAELSNSRERVRQQFIDATEVLKDGGPRFIIAGGQEWGFLEETGEWHRVQYREEGRALYDLSPRSERVRQELEHNRQRMWVFAGTGGIAFIGLLIFLGDQHLPGHGPGMGEVFGVLIGAPALVTLVWVSVLEWRYRHGSQRIDHPMVLDPPARNSEREDMEKQKVHGGARVATEEETVGAAKRGSGRRSRVHSQKF